METGAAGAPFFVAQETRASSWHTLPTGSHDVPILLHGLLEVALN